MAFLLNDRLIFLHIPKTGGNWLTKLLRQSDITMKKISDKHATYDLVSGQLQERSARPIFGLKKRQYEFFAVVRNPLTWYESWFKYQSYRFSLGAFKDWGANGDPYNWHCMSPLNFGHIADFNDFMERVNERAPGFAGHLFCASTSNSGARILKAESIRSDLVRLSDEFKLDLNQEEIMAAPNYGVSPKIPIVWRRDVFEETIRLEAATFKRFGYDWSNIVNVGNGLPPNRTNEAAA